MLERAWSLLRATIEGFIADEAMSRGAAIAYYTIFSLAPLLVIAIALAGIVFGTEAVQGVVAAELAGMHPQTLRQYDRLGIVSPRRSPG